MLLKIITCYSLYKLFSDTKTELRSMYAELTLPFGVGISKYDLITNMSNAMINEEENTIDLSLALIDKEEEHESFI